MSENYLGCYRDQVILVTGGAGAIGSNLVRALANAGAKKVIILDNLFSSYEWNIPNLPNVLFVKGDITNDIDLKRVFNEKPSYIFHLAAFFANQNSVDYPETDLLVSGLGTIKVLEYAVLCGNIKRFVYAGSGCAIYGTQAPLPLKEEFVSLHLSTPYQISKMTGELYCNFYFHHYDLPIVKTRFFNSYGPGEVPGQYRNVIPNFIYWAMKGQPLPITGSGKMTRDFTYVTDIVDALMRAGFYEKAIGAEMNIASGEETEIVAMAEMINQFTGNNAGIVQTDKRKWDTKSRLKASIDRARDLLGYNPKINFEKGLPTVIQWFSDHWNQIDRDAEFPPGMSSAVKNYVLKQEVVV
ncbi:MAG: nucleotide sugar epimerase [Gammaproteobacteria bacterium RIFCSPLOWO2_02_FULL_42_14]|nr:MAG: nucleotide sugar epimerase [Gammaproteobacteria bacterium RIFCSPHIGHO2_02_FULL_42_43]OGT51478.1 MAG: nucleotide sugar epimerase [Gammaproteobacteria bacterium RIFCSPHIGHO2_12_FULL_41_25]OGT62179.1 MAG: nucleotide sugar epimerase [Gammaproteobacteria bacterium RIFCSPLOWO2_02_FULL_42_14]OGT85852.1 MAG: nucleotide sugar epimerase [Gammaproteobacteria bacterium RIFCSPLOWO2_12_FULL_42_18]